MLAPLLPPLLLLLLLFLLLHTNSTAVIYAECCLWPADASAAYAPCCELWRLHSSNETQQKHVSCMSRIIHICCFSAISSRVRIWLTRVLDAPDSVRVVPL
jgi:hypothetical protein